MKSANRTILIAGMGTSPAVLTETVWALAHQENELMYANYGLSCSGPTNNYPLPHAVAIWYNWIAMLKQSFRAFFFLTNTDGSGKASSYATSARGRLTITRRSLWIRRGAGHVE